MGGVVRSSDNCSLKGKWSGGDRAALSPHLFSGKALLSSRWAAEESMEQLLAPGGVRQPGCGAALRRRSTAALSSSSPCPRRHTWAPASWGAPFQACRSFSEPGCCGDGPFCLQDLPSSSSPLVASSIDMNVSSFAALLLCFPHSQESKASRTLWNRQ